MGLKRFIKKIIPKEISRPVKAIVDPVIDFTTNTVKAVLSPFTGGFDLPDTAINFDATSSQIKATTTVNFNAANRAMPVLYGDNVSVGTIPIFVGTHGDNSADTSPQYLYMAAVISQGFHGAATLNYSSSPVGAPVFGSLLSRMTIDGKPVNLGVGTLTLNDTYSDGYDGSTALGKTTTVSGIRSYGYGGTQPPQHSITKGTFANRLTFQYFDGSSDQPVSSLLREHPDWDDDQNTLSGVHYLAMRFLIQAADETVPAGDGGGTFGNPYSGIPAVVVTTSGKSTPNIIVGSSDKPGYAERFEKVYADERVIDNYISPHKPLGKPDADGIISGIDNVAKNVVAVDSDTVIELKRFNNFQSEKFTNGTTQPFNIHNYLYNLGWTYDWVYFEPSYYRYNSDSSLYSPSYGTEDRGQWLKHVGGGHYQFVNRMTDDISTTIAGGELTFFAYDSNLTESIINGVSPTELVGDSTSELGEYRFYSTASVCQYIVNHWYTPSTPGDWTIKLRVRDIKTGRNDVYDVIDIDESNISDAVSPYITFGLRNEDSTEVPNDFYTTVPIDADIYVELRRLSFNNTDKRPAYWELLQEQGYLVDGLSHQGYFPDSNPVEYLLDYMLNPNYGMGLSLNDIDRESFIRAAIACDRIPDFYNLDDRTFYFGGNALDVTQRNEYMYGENASPGLINNSYYATSDNTYDRQFVIDTARTHLNNVNQILTSIGAIMPVIEGKFKLILENAGVPDNSEAIPPVTALPITAHITDEHIVDSVSINTASLNDKFNQVKIDYTDLQNSSQPNSAMSPDPIDDSTDIRTNYLAEDNNKSLEGTFAFTGVYDRITAKKVATLLLKKSRGQPVLNFTATHTALNCLPGDFIRFESAMMKINSVFRVTTANLNADNTVTMSCIKHVPEFYDVSDTGQVFEGRRDIMDLK